MSERIIGIDPGSVRCGYAIFTSGGSRASRFGSVLTAEGRYLASGTISLPPKSPLHVRLKHLHAELSAVMLKYRPSEAAVEKIFYAKSIRAALSLGYARAIALLCVAEAEVELNEYSPLEVKKAVTGYGRAEKRQVAQMMASIISESTGKPPAHLQEDEADACALALCHLNTSRFKNLLK